MLEDQGHLESSYDEGSSQEIIVEFGQHNRELIGSVIADGVMNGDFGSAEIFQSRGDKLVILDSATHELRVVKQIYRGIVVKSNKKKESKAQQLKNQPKNAGEQEANEKSSENLFDSSSSSPEEVAKKRRKKQTKPSASQFTGKTRIIRKIRTLSKKHQANDPAK